MKSLQDLNSVLFEQIDKLMIDDNFNDDNGKFSQKLFDAEIRKTEQIINLSKQVCDVSNLQLNAVKVAAEWNVKRQELPALLGITPPVEDNK